MKTVKVKMPIGKVIDMGYDGVIRVSLNGAYPMIRPYRHKGKVVFVDTIPPQGDCYIDEDTIVDVEFEHPDSLGSRAKEIRKLINE